MTDEQLKTLPSSFILGWLLAATIDRVSADPRPDSATDSARLLNEMLRRVDPQRHQEDVKAQLHDLMQKHPAEEVLLLKSSKAGYAKLSNDELLAANDLVLASRYPRTRSATKALQELRAEMLKRFGKKDKA